MAHDAPRPRTVPTPPELADYARRVISSHTDRDAARLVGVSRTALCRAAAGCPVMPGTLAMLREAIRDGRAAA